MSIISKSMPVLSKFSRTADMCTFQDNMILSEMFRITPSLNVLKNYTRKVDRFSYEAERMYMTFYHNIQLVVGGLRAQSLADYLFKGSYPKSQELRWFIDYYTTAQKKIQKEQ